MTDSIESKDEIALAIRAAMICKAAGGLVNCRSWTVAQLILAELRLQLRDLDGQMPGRKSVVEKARAEREEAIKP